MELDEEDWKGFWCILFDMDTRGPVKLYNKWENTINQLVDTSLVM